MNAHDFLQLLRRKPFIPMRIHMSDGEKYDIFHPDNILVTHSYIEIGRSADPQGVVDRIDHCSLGHVVRIEDIARKSKAKS